MRASAFSFLTRHWFPGHNCVIESALGLLFFLSACSPNTLQAGHSLAGAESAPQKATPSGKADSPRAENPSDTEPSPNQDNESHPVVTRPTDEPPLHFPHLETLPAGGQRIGETGGIAVEGLSATGHWVATCQPARSKEAEPRPDMPSGLHGEVIQPFELQLFWGAQQHKIDALLRSDESGRFLVVLDQKQAWLVDVISQSRINLSALQPDLVGDNLPDHRSFAFSDAGLIVISEREEIDAYYVALPLENEKDILANAVPIEFGKNPVWRIDAGTGYVTAVMLKEGQTNQAWPVPKATQQIHRCQGATPTFAAYPRINSHRPDRDLTYSWLKLPKRLEKQQKLFANPAPGYVMAHGEGWVRREDSGRLVYVSGGTQKQIASERCGARILHADERSGLFVVACEEYTPIALPSAPPKKNKAPPKYRFDLYLLRPGFVRALSADTARTGVDVKGQPGSRLIPLRPGSAAALVDLKELKLIPLAPSIYVLATGGQHALLRDENQLKLWSPQGVENLDYPVSSLSRILTSGVATAIDDQLFLLGSSLSTQKLPAPPMAVTPRGFALVPQEPATETRWARGPLLLIGPSEKVFEP